MMADYRQNTLEHWDVQGTLEGQLSKFEVKGLKRFKRKDPEPQDENGVHRVCGNYWSSRMGPGKI